jgi:hypothetical protein
MGEALAGAVDHERASTTLQANEPCAMGEALAVAAFDHERDSTTLQATHPTNTS